MQQNLLLRKKMSQFALLMHHFVGKTIKHVIFIFTIYFSLVRETEL